MIASSMTIENLLCAPVTPCQFSLAPNTVCMATALPDSGFETKRSISLAPVAVFGHKTNQVPPPPPPLPSSSKYFLLSLEDDALVEKRRHSVQEHPQRRSPPLEEQRRFSVQEQHHLAGERRNSLEDQRRFFMEEERRNSIEEECNRRESLEEKFESTEPFASIVVFVHEVKPESTCAVQLSSPVEANIWDITSKIQAQTGIPRSSQKVTVLVSPEPHVFLMGNISEREARSVEVPLTASVLVSNLQSRTQQQQPESERCLNTFPLRSGRQLKIASSEPPSPQDAILNEVRQKLTEVLCDIRKHVSLDMIARMTTRSKSSLSLWRRGMYRGNNLLIAKAVTAALQELERNGWKYVPAIHNGSIRL